MDGTVQKQSGDSADLVETIISEHEASLLRYATRILSNPSAAQDVVQNVFIRLCEKWQHGMQPSVHLRNWLYRVTHNEAVDHIRRESRRQVLHEKAALEGADIELPPVNSDEERREQVLTALERLHPREQQVVLLRLEEGLSYAQIAEITGRSEGNVGNILHHAILKLSDGVKRDSAVRGATR